MIAEHDAQAAQRAQQAALHAAAGPRGPAKPSGQQEGLEAHADHNGTADGQAAQGAEGGMGAADLGSKSSEWGSRRAAQGFAGSMRGPGEAGREATASHGTSADPGRSGL